MNPLHASKLCIPLLKRIKVSSQQKISKAINYLLYPALAVGTFIFLYDTLHNIHGTLPNLFGTYLTYILALMVLFELLNPLRENWKTTRSNFLRRDFPFIIIASLAINATNYIMVMIESSLNFIHLTAFIHTPFLVGVIFAILITDFVTYWIHRACHENKGRLGKFLWRIHMPHHLPRQVNLAMQSLTHPINLIIARATFSLPLFFLGFSPEVIFTTTVLTTFQGAVSHFNVDIRVGWLNYLLIGTELHRYHHSAKSIEAKNFGIVVSIWDQLFGTFYYKPGEIPESLGIEDRTLYPKDTDIFGLMAYPFTDQNVS